MSLQRATFTEVERRAMWWNPKGEPSYKKVWKPLFYNEYLQICTWNTNHTKNTERKQRV
jgi:hypothetical protein